MLQVTLPDELQERVQKRASQAGRGADEWVLAALENQLRQEFLEQKMAEALASGPPIATDDQWWQELEDEALREIEKRK